MESYWTKQYEEINYATDRGNIEDWQVYTGETPSVYTGPKEGFQLITWPAWWPYTIETPRLGL